MMNIQALPTLSCGEAMKICCSKFCDCSGRARRSEYWYFSLFFSLLSIIPIALYFYLITDLIVNYRKNRGELSGGNLAILIIIFLFLFFFIFALIPVTVRRLHDTGKSGLLYFLSCLPFGSFILLFFLVEDSQPNINQYGPSPKYVQIQGSPLIVNQQAILLNGIPAPNYPIPQVNLQVQVNPYQQYPQAPMEQNLYQGPTPAYPSNQA